MPVTFPAELTKANLVKNKKLLAGLNSPSLERDINLLEHTFADSYFVHADPEKLGKETLDPIKFARNRDGFKKVLDTQRKKMEGMADRLENDLKGIKTTLAANKKTDKKVAAYADTLFKAAHKFAFALKPVATNELVYLIERAYKAHLAKSQAFGMVELVMKETPKRHNALLAEIATVRRIGTVDAVHETWKSGSSNARNYYIELCAGWDQAVRKAFPELAAAAPVNGEAGKIYVKLPWIADVANEAQSKASSQLKAALGGSEDEQDVVETMLGEYEDSVEEMWKLFAHMQTAWRELSKWK
jgi:hypothetical protein